MYEVTYPSRYTNPAVYNLFYSTSKGGVFAQYYALLSLFKSKNPEMTEISILDVMHGTGDNLPILKCVAALCGITLKSITLHDQMPIVVNDSEVNVITCDFGKLHTKVIEPVDLIVSVFSGFNCHAPYKEDPFAPLIELGKKAKECLFTLTHPVYWDYHDALSEQSEYVPEEHSPEDIAKLGFPVELSSSPVFVTANVTIFKELMFDRWESRTFRDEVLLEAVQDGKPLFEVYVDSSKNHVRTFPTKALSVYGEVFLLSGEKLVPVDGLSYEEEHELALKEDLPVQVLRLK